jgi:DNA-binding transcriptional LysR family regulator
LVAAQQLVDSAEALRQMTANRRGKPMGRVWLAVPVSLGLHLSDKIGRLLTRYEELSVDLVLRDGASDLIEEGLDLEVRIGPIEDAALIARCIGWTTAHLVAAPSYLEGRCPPAHPRDPSGTIASSITAGAAMTPGGSTLRLAIRAPRSLSVSGAGFAPTMPPPSNGRRSTGAESLCCRISWSRRTSRRGGCGGCCPSIRPGAFRFTSFTRCVRACHRAPAP